MSFWRSFKRRVREAVLPAVFLSLAFYFAWSSYQGQRGLDEQKRREQAMLAAKADLDNAHQEEAVWQRRVNALRTEHLDIDALDERVRDRLNLSNPDDLIMLYPKDQRLF
jgi:cell division protein FtsB